jgi:hypothetical protein
VTVPQLEEEDEEVAVGASNRTGITVLCLEGNGASSFPKGIARDRERGTGRGSESGTGRRVGASSSSSPVIIVIVILMLVTQ